MLFEIKHRFTASVLFTVTTDTIKLAVEAAISGGADLSGAILSGADLIGADLSGADLRGAILSYADLSGAILSGADLRGADLRGAILSGAILSDADLIGAILRGADLSGADLRYADLSGADLSGAILSYADLSGAILSYADLSGAILSGCINISSSTRAVFSCVGIGSRDDTLFAFATNKGIYVKTGCFLGTLDEFKARVTTVHGDNVHGQEYAAAYTMIEAHFQLWPTEKT